LFIDVSLSEKQKENKLYNILIDKESLRKIRSDLCGDGRKY